MDDVRVKFSFLENGTQVSFNQVSELKKDQFIELQKSFLSIELFLYKTAAVQWLSDNLKLDATKIVDVHVGEKGSPL